MKNINKFRACRNSEQDFWEQFCRSLPKRKYLSSLFLRMFLRWQLLPELVFGLPSKRAASEGNKHTGRCATMLIYCFLRAGEG